ncbi:putative Nudix hydrolase NudL [Mycena indigotica]|uniref:Putative Nudix hydrolase NudL n=1 Tax=Mycena indigotica TaxID=2126181 RepID=A0A8H6WCD7_9AGAR|nr:putative Nudix hydrolase NudL [Mycena indigotica]KAF7309648.1 putative Nudix hydrolase NudL [Mycena indigotica]
MLNRPLSRQHLRAIQTALMNGPPSPPWTNVDKTKTAAILISLCNVRDVGSILLQVRSRTLRSHSGEVSCPGGMVDPEDVSLIDTALRETMEELGIQGNRVEPLGFLHPPERSLRGDVVWPLVGFVHTTAERKPQTDPDDEALPSIDISAIQNSSSKDEVELVFHLPLTELINPTRLRAYLFRNERPYSAIDVSDLVPPNSGLTSVSTEPPQGEIGPGTEGRIEVWGLTGWYLSLLSSTLKSLFVEA